MDTNVHIYQQYVFFFTGVHCTHGFNRTGFLIISYLVEQLSWEYVSLFRTFSLNFHKFALVFVQTTLGLIAGSKCTVSSPCVFSLHAAIQCFARARPPGIYKQDYLQELFRRYDEEENTIPAPPLPDWCDGKKKYSQFIRMK